MYQWYAIIEGIMDKTSGDLRTVLELVITQRAGSSSNVFKYDFSLMRQKLKETQDFNKYSVDAEMQRALLKQLGNEGFIHVNYVDENNRAWKHDTKIIAELIAPDFNPLAHLTDVYIYLPLEDIEPLEYQYGLGTYSAELFLEYGHFIVKCNGRKYRMPQLTEDRPPAQILEYAFRHHDSIVTRDDLLRDGAMKKHGQKTISKICKGSKPLLTVLSPFITLTADRIIVKLLADINRFELDVIANHAIETKKR